MRNDKSQYSILFVEDEKEIRDNYTKYLKRHFSEVYEAEDGLEGYEIYKDKKPELMIVDINLPKMNGIELLQKIRQTDHSVKVIMLTANSDQTNLLSATELKLVKYLVKPITRDDLKNALDMAIEEYSKFEVISKKVLHLSDNYTWNFDLEELYYNNDMVSLTQKEQKLLNLLFLKPNRTISYEQILLEVWEDEIDAKIDSVKTVVKNVRRKLPKDIIKNVFGIGYKY